MIQNIFYAALLGVVVSCLIFPNSLKMLSVASLALGFMCAASRVKFNAEIKFTIGFWAASTIVSIIYILIGIVNGAPTEAITQVVLIYIIFPLVWIFVIAYLLRIATLHSIVSGLITVAFIACLSVFYFYYSFLNYGPDSVLFFIEKPNVDITSSRSVAATMYVFGSLIFLIGGYVASFSLLEGNRKNHLLLLLLVFVALISGRGALILSVGIGLFISVLATLAHKKKIFFRNTLSVAIGTTLVLITLDYFDLGFGELVKPLIEKIFTLGGEGRSQQFVGLIDGISDNYGLGSGHGIGVDYKVNDNYPWRYEMVWLATIYRVGIIGAII